MDSFFGEYYFLLSVWDESLVFRKWLVMPVGSNFLV